MLATLALSALFLAHGHDAASSPARCCRRSRSPRAGRRRRRNCRPAPSRPTPHAILARNIFDPTTGPLWPPKPPPTPPRPPTPRSRAAADELEPGEIPPPCEGTAAAGRRACYSERMPEWSFATLERAAATNAAAVPHRRPIDDNEIVEILPKAVFLRQGNGQLCSLALFFARPQPAAAAARPPPVAAADAAAAARGRPTPARAASAKKSMNQNIHAVSETKYTVPQTFVDKILQNQAELMRSARIVPHEENGQVVGVKLYGIRRNSLLGKLGLQNGDLLRTINGFDMASPDTALEAYAGCAAPATSRSRSCGAARP